MRLLILSLLFFVLSFSKELISTIPISVEYDKNKALLGKKLFFDPILSKDGTISCSSCHDLEAGGDDGMRTSVGIGGQLGSVNAPTVLNSRYNFVQFWNGNAKDLKEQALGPIHNPIEMGSTSEEILKKLNGNQIYIKLFKVVYKDGVTMDNIADAIEEFESAIITPNSRFDLYLRGDENAISKNEKEGYTLFKSLGCISCHNGINIGSNIYQKMGVFYEFEENDNLGRYDVTKDDDDKYFYKVPTLRNISKTAPYFHDGREETLRGAIDKMTHYQLGRSIPKEQIELLYEFLLTLDGEKPKILDEK